MAEFRMPILGADMTSGKLIEWRKQPGDRLKRGDILVEVETDKADIEVEVFHDGVLEQTLVQPGERVPVGTPLAIIRVDGEPAEMTADRRPPAAAEIPAARPAAAGPPRPTLPAPPAAGGVRASPVARRLAAQLGVDLATVAGTGPGGRIQERDVEQAAKARAAVPATAPVVAAAPALEPVADRPARMRQAIAAAMARSSREIPHFHLTTTIDLGPALTWLAGENERRPVAERLLYGVLLIKSVALALRQVPELNGRWLDGRVVPQPDIHVGQAISLRGGGLVAPALHHTDRQSLDELMRNLRDLVQRARAGTLRSSEFTDPTITITSLGEQGAEAVFGLIYPPQVALVGFGRVVERPWITGGEIVARPVITATLTADHRVVDGHRGSVFLSAVDRLLQEPGQL